MDDPHLKICDVVQFYSTLSGGVRRYIHEKRAYLLKNTPHAHCLVIPSHRDAVTRNERTTLYEIKSPKLIGSNSYRMLINRKKILKAISHEKPDLIEVGDPYRAAWIGLKAAGIHSIPIVAFYHSDYPRALDRTLHKYAGRRVEALIAPLIQKYLVRLYNRMSTTVVSSKRCYDALDRIGIKRLRQIPLGTNLDAFNPRDSRSRIFKELEISGDHKLLLFVGRLAREKNIRSLFAMMDMLRTGNQRHHLVLIGDGEWRDEVRRKSREEPDISWMHFIESPERLADFYSAADLFVHAGDCETFGLVSLEAQACGTRVLAVKGGGLDEGLMWEEPQIMAENTSGEALAKAVTRVWQLQEGKLERGLRRQKMENHYSWNATFSQLTGLYAQMVEKNSPHRQAEETNKDEPEDSALLSR